MLGPDDVGHRVVVRRVVGGTPDRPMRSDVLGDLVSVTDRELTVVTRDGPVTIPRQTVVAAKRVPPPPVRRADVVALELAADEGWPAPERQRLGEWWLRATEGWSRRGNSALAVGDPGVPLSAAIDTVTTWYTSRGLPPMVTVPLPLGAAVDAELAARGWTAYPRVLVQTADLAAIDEAAPPRPDLPEVQLATTPSPDWLALVSGRKGTLPPAARHLLTAGGRVPVRFADVRDRRGTLLAVGRGSVTGDGTWLGLTLIEVVPQARRRGLATHLIRALAAWGASRGARTAFLQVEEHNAAAVALYHRLGFHTHHRYVTRAHPGVSAG